MDDKHNAPAASASPTSNAPAVARDEGGAFKRGPCLCEHADDKRRAHRPDCPARFPRAAAPASPTRPATRESERIHLKHTEPLTQQEIDALTIDGLHAALALSQEEARRLREERDEARHEVKAARDLADGKAWALATLLGQSDTERERSLVRDAYVAGRRDRIEQASAAESSARRAQERAEAMEKALRQVELRLTALVEGVRAVGKGHWDAPHWTLHVPAREANALFDLAYGDETTKATEAARAALSAAAEQEGR